MSIKKQSQKQEQRITKTLKEIKEEAKQTMNSGAIWFNKSDVVSKNFRVEAKTKVKPSKSITIKKEWLDKIENEAFLTGKTPALVFSCPCFFFWRWKRLFYFNRQGFLFHSRKNSYMGG